MTKKSIGEKPAGFLEALKAYMFFTRRYIFVFYSVLLFAAFFAILISLVSIGLVFFNFFTGEGGSGELQFTLLVLIFFGIGFQALMALASIAYNLWNITFQDHNIEEEFPATLDRVMIIRSYYKSTNNFIAKFLTFLVPGLISTAILVVPLFSLVMLLAGIVDFKETSPTILRDIFIPDSFLVGLSVFLMNFNYYLETKLVNKS